jgi:copper chaperone CopZ
MNFKHIFLALTVCFFIASCKKEVPVKKEKVALAISGMTCEIGCAKTIQSKLSKKEGVIDAKVVFSDSIATINYDANTTSKEDLIAFVGGIAGGELYTASETLETPKKTKDKKSCTKNCKEKCDASADKKDCCTEDENGKHICKNDDKMSCCKTAA